MSLFLKRLDSPHLTLLLMLKQKLWGLSVNYKIIYVVNQGSWNYDPQMKLSAEHLVLHTKIYRNTSYTDFTTDCPWLLLHYEDNWAAATKMVYISSHWQYFIWPFSEGFKSWSKDYKIYNWSILMWINKNLKVSLLEKFPQRPWYLHWKYLFLLDQLMHSLCYHQRSY